METPAPPVPPNDLSVNGGGPPISFHTKSSSKRLLQKNLKIRGDTGKQVLYNFEFPLRLSGSWSQVLRRDSSEGPIVLTINKSPSGSGADKLLQLADGSEWRTPLIQTSFFSDTHEFLGMDGLSKYRWYRRGMSSNWTLDKKLPNGHKQVIAKLKVPIWTASRCHLLINRACENEKEVILGTALAMNAWRNWR